MPDRGSGGGSYTDAVLPTRCRTAVVVHPKVPSFPDRRLRLPLRER
jgi:hypothetical protein